MLSIKDFCRVAGESLGLGKTMLSIRSCARHSPLRRSRFRCRPFRRFPAARRKALFGIGVVQHFEFSNAEKAEPSRPRANCPDHQKSHGRARASVEASSNKFN
jgi:hypothetical protein